ncbi:MULTISPECIES: glycosyltransferase [unclassified Micromonospora]|uniref:glycosyltransferase n=1 Tax=unclassified Micromonospora TaxID=2617518 RepID=UPI002FF241EB
MRTPDGRVWTTAGPAYPAWSRYLAAFDRVRIVARVEDVAHRPAGAAAIDGPNVDVWPVPYYVGPRQYLARRRAVREAVVAAVTPQDACIMRTPSQIATVLYGELRRRRQPYALEVIGDPHDVFAPGVVRHPLRPLIRHRFTAQLAAQCRSASAVCYVTDTALQTRYPAGAGVPAVSCSDVNLPSGAYVTRPRPVEAFAAASRLVSVGSLDQLYKGIDTLLEALGLLARSHPELRLVHVGDGRFRAHLVELTRQHRITDRVTFAGALPPGEAVRDQLDAADLFVMPSRTEGMPRALIEAMARGLPAIGSAVGGIPELLSPDDLVPRDDPARLAESISRMLADRSRAAEASARNLARAHDFRAERLDVTRRHFLDLVRQRSHRSVTEPATRG